MNPDRLLEVLDLLTARSSESGGEGLLAGELVEWARDHGLVARLDEVGPGRASAIIGTSGGPGSAVILSGHIDTLPHNRVAPTRHGLVGERYYAPEVNNMKAAVAAMVEAVLVLREREVPGSVTLLAAAGECDTIGLGTVSALRSGLHADHAINGEPTDLRLLSEHAGVYRIRVLASGKNLFTGNGDPRDNANVALARFLTAISSPAVQERLAGTTRHPLLPRLNIGVIRGGSAPAMLADTAEAQLDVRSAPGMTIDSVCELLESCVPAEDAGRLRVEALAPPEFLNPSAFVSDPGWRCVTAVAEAHMAETGRPSEYGAHVPEVFYGSDAPHLVAAGIPTCIYGPGASADISSVNESISWPDVQTAARVYIRAAAALMAPVGVGEVRPGS